MKTCNLLVLRGVDLDLVVIAVGDHVVDVADVQTAVDHIVIIVAEFQLGAVDLDDFAVFDLEIQRAAVDLGYKVVLRHIGIILTAARLILVVNRADILVIHRDQIIAAVGIIDQRAGIAHNLGVFVRINALIQHLRMQLIADVKEGELQAALNIPVYMGKGGDFYARDSVNNGSIFFEREIILNDVTFLDEGELALDANPNFKLEVIAAPGHTLDGTIYYSEKDSVAFVGDTIFYGGHGRTDLAGGSQRDLMNTIINKVFALPDETVLLCGHGPRTTVAAEKYRQWYRDNA